ncbi:MAG: type VI secretion protein [Chitinophagaceae bacterium]|nr:MAG: type VI secretion protein [Chitinophagaceae bacterium]
MPSAARITDMHTCPLATPNPHIGGPISGPSVTNVLIGGLPAAVLGDICICAGPPDAVVRGSSSVFIGGRPAARQFDSTAHGGIISVGFPTVQIGG